MRCPTLAELPPPPAGKTGWPWTEESAQLPELMPDGQPWPRISIVTPLYNHEVFIEETIRSVLLQGYPDFEHIVVDDGSTDGGPALVDKYSPWVRRIVQNREGQSAALNRGFRQATGELIGWQNSDDFYAPDHFENGALAAAQFPDVEIYHGTARGFWGMNCRPPWLFEVCEEFSRPAFLERMCVMNQSMFFRRAIFERGLFIKEDLHYVMDQEYFWRLSLEGVRYHLVPPMVGYYRQQEHAKSLSGRGDLEKYALLRNLCRERRLDASLRREARAKLRSSFLGSLRRARRTFLKKLIPELLMPIADDRG